MARTRSISKQTAAVLRALSHDADEWRHGYDLGRELGLKSGSLYPILIRLADRGQVEARWETVVTGKPPRHLYRITGAGLEALAAAEPADAKGGAANPPRRSRLRTA